MGCIFCENGRKIPRTAIKPYGDANVHSEQFVPGYY